MKRVQISRDIFTLQTAKRKEYREAKNDENQVREEILKIKVNRKRNA